MKSKLTWVRPRMDVAMLGEQRCGVQMAESGILGDARRYTIFALRKTVNTRCAAAKVEKGAIK
jgi:hypothetical protein